MASDFKTWTKGLYSVTGSTLAGPAGALIGSLAGGLITAAAPGVPSFLGDLSSHASVDTVESAVRRLLGEIDPGEEKRINHDLQTTFRDALREAIYDLGGERCFPQVWQARPRPVPTDLPYLDSPEGDALWQAQDPLAEQVGFFFKEMLNAIAEQRLLPLEPPQDRPVIGGYASLVTETPRALQEAFFNTIFLPFYNGFAALRSGLPDFETYLRRGLLDRALVHLGEVLKSRDTAWCAYNRRMLEALRSQVRRIDAGPLEILPHLEALLDQPGGLDPWCDGLADLLSAAGSLEKSLSEGFEVVLERLAEQQNEALLRFGQLLTSLGRIEGHAPRVLHTLEDGQYAIEGTPSMAVDEPPAPGEPPYKGLHYFTAQDADVFFGREALTARLVSRLRPATAIRKAAADRGNFLAVIGASGCGKSSIVRAGLVPAIHSGQPLANGELPPAGSADWLVYAFTPTGQPLSALAASLTRQSPSNAESATLAGDLRRDPGSLGRRVHGLLKAEAESKARKPTRTDRLLLVVDQFEEVFTLCRDETERQAFIDALLTALDTSPLLLVIILRADFYAQCARYENLRRAIAACQEYIGPLSAAEARRAIEEPARHTGWELEGGLVDAILLELGGDQGLTRPGALPQLEHALLETWKHRRRRGLVYESYTESGGVHGAIARTADTVFFHQYNPSQQALARRILLRLVETGEDTLDTRRRLPLSELASSPETAEAAQGVLQALAEADLIRLDQDSVEVAHEALLREWPALRAWLEQERQAQTVRSQVSAAAQNWQQLNRDAGAVLRGVQLAQAVEWAETHDDQVGTVEREFIEFSQFAAERQAAAHEAQRQGEIEAAHALVKAAEARRKDEAERAQLAEQRAGRLRRNNWIISGVSVLVVVAAILAGVAAGYNRQQASRASRTAESARQSQATAQAASTQAMTLKITADAQAEGRATAQAEALAQKAAAEAAQAEAQRQSRISLSRELAAQSSGLASRDPDLALLLAVHAVDIADEPGLPPVAEAQTALFHALQIANDSTVLRGHTNQVLSAVYSPDGKSLLTTSQDGSARLWEIASGQAITIAAYTGGITSASFNQDGTLILTTGQAQGQDGVAEVWKPDGSRVATLAGHTGSVLSGSFSPDGTLVVTAGQDKTARLWKVDGAQVATLTGHVNPVTAASFSPGGQRILTLSTDATARLWDLSGAPVATLAGHTQPILAASFSPDSGRIVTASADGTARIWLADGTPVATLEGHTGPVTFAVFSPDGQKILTAGNDATARVWRSDGSLLAVLRGHSGPLTMASFSPDGAHILTASADATARLWRTDGSPITTLTGHTGAVYAASFNAQGSQIVTAGADDTVRVWDIDRLYAPILANLTVPVAWAGFSPDGKQVLTAGMDGIARIYRRDGTLIATLTGHTGGLTNASFSPDGAMIATTSRDGTARIWSKDGMFLTELKGHTGPVHSASFSADSKLVVTAGEDGTARVYRISGSLVRTLEGHTGVVWSAFFSPDGNSVVTASQDGTARIWDSAGKVLHTIDNNAVPVDMAVFSPDGQMVITAGQDGIARLWLADGTPLLSLEGHTQMVNWAAFSPDGKLIATASNDGAARLWTMDGKFLASVEGHTQRVASVGFSPDGRLLVTAGWNGTVRLWSVSASLQAMRAEALRQAGRWLTRDECQRYLHQLPCPPAP